MDNFKIKNEFLLRNFTNFPEADLINDESELEVLNKLIETLSILKQTKLLTLLIFLIFLISLYFLLKEYPDIPWMIVSSIIGILIGILLQSEIDTLNSKFGNLSFKLYDLNYLREKGPLFLLNPHLWIESITIAFIISSGTLITGKVLDSITGTTYNKQKEIVALRLANICSGILGGIPIAGLPARTILNIKSGCTNKISNLFCSVVILLISAFMLKYMGFMPLAIIAAQVVITAIRMIMLKLLKVFMRKIKEIFTMLF